MIYLLLFASAIYAVHKLRERPKRPRLEYRPEWYEPETVDLDPFEDTQDDQEPATEDEFKRTQAQLDIEHWESVKSQYEALQTTIKAEIEAIRKTRADKARLQTLADKPLEYMELAASIDKRDYSERREATLQRQLITAENNIYACNKRIAKARQILKGV